MEQRAHNSTRTDAAASSEPRLTLSEAALAELARRACEAAGQAGCAGQRYLLGIAGIGGGGKSTLAARLQEQVEALRPGVSVVLPMDGFHLSNAELDRRGLRPMKGSPPTFAAAEFIALLRKIQRAGVSSYFPLYDRGLHEPVLRERPEQLIGPQVELVIVEGNYLLLDEEPWRELAGVLDSCWLLATPVEQAKQWIVARHLRGGKSEAQALAHYQRCDRANAEKIHNCRRRAELVLAWPQGHGGA